LTDSIRGEFDRSDRDVQSDDSDDFFLLVQSVTESKGKQIGSTRREHTTATDPSGAIRHAQSTNNDNVKNPSSGHLSA
jgi:hypothetical protein